MRRVRRPSPSCDSDSDSDSDADSSYQSGNSLAPIPTRPRRRSPVPTNRTGSVVKNGTFQKFLFLLVVVVIFDVVFMWDYLEALDDTADGPEAGLHHLHESRRIGKLYRQMITLGQLGREKVEMLEWEVGAYLEAAHTVIPPNEGNDDQAGDAAHPTEPRARFENDETYGVDEHIVKILNSASVAIDEELAGQLPTWDGIVSLYGDKPIIHGLDTCEPYRQAVMPRDRMTGPAGIFNTGTNLLFQLLKRNCDIKEARGMMNGYSRREPLQNGMRWQAPWGKHNPPSTHRNINVAKAWGEGVKQDDFLPVVLIKDPYTWMRSQCRHKYTTFWGHDDEHCPNLIRWMIPDKAVPSTVRVLYALQMKMYESMLDMWNQWYQEWEEQTFPHLTTRFEDLLFHGEEVTRQVCDCVGGVFTDNFQYVEDSAKPAASGIHKGANGLVKAMLQYGDPKKHLEGYTDRDRWYASKTVNTHLMKRYGYTAPPLPT